MSSDFSHCLKEQQVPDEHTAYTHSAAIYSNRVSNLLLRVYTIKRPYHAFIQLLFKSLLLRFRPVEKQTSENRVVHSLDHQ